MAKKGSRYALGSYLLIGGIVYFALQHKITADYEADVALMELKEANAARIAVRKATTDIAKCFDLAIIAKTDFNRGNIEEARLIATKLLAIAAKAGPKSDPDQYGVAIHDGNMVLGQIALRENRVDDAKAFLLKAGTTPGACTLNSFGPNMSLANNLLEAGESATVLAYFKECQSFWSFRAETLEEWTRVVSSDGTPDFGSNLYY